MTNLIRNWLLSMTCAAMAMTLAETIAPKGSVKKILRLTGGLILVLAVIGPVKDWDSSAFDNLTSSFQSTVQVYQEDLELQQEILYEGIIAENIAAYILDKAERLGMTCQVKVTVFRGEDGVYYPDQVTVTGTWTAQQKEELQDALESELGIPTSMQCFEEKKS